jgi:hypothetical protein
LFQEYLQYYSEYEKEKIELNLLFELYPKLFSNVLEISSTNKNALSFTEKQKIIIRKYQFIQFIIGTSEKFQEKHFFSQNNVFFIFIPNSIISLSNKCFLECLCLSQINLPSSFTSFGHKCFLECLSLSQINFPTSITSLGNECFSNCSKLSQIYLPNTVASIGHECFPRC